MVGAALAFLLGALTRPHPPADETADEGGIRDAAPGSPALSPRRALGLPGDRAGARALARAVEGIQSSAEFQSAFEELLPGFDEARTHDALFMLADAWAALAPEEACIWLDKLELNDARHPYLFAALTQWARADPGAAVAWLEASHSESGPGRDYLLAAVVRGMAGNNPEAALEILLASPRSPERVGAIDFLVRAWSSSGSENAFREIAALPASEVRLKERGFEVLADGLGVAELKAASAWAASLPGAAERRAAESAIAASWGRHEPESALEWAGSLDDVAARANAYGEIATRWARADPLAAGRWLAQNAGRPEHDLAARAVAWSTVGIDPETAFQQVSAITSGALRNETFEQLGRRWLSEQPQVAKEFLEGESPIPPAIRERLLESFE